MKRGQRPVVPRVHGLQHVQRLTAAALAHAAAHKVALERADAADWAEARLAEPPRDGVARVLMHSIAWQYFAPATQDRIAAALASVALSGLLTYDYSGSTLIESGSHLEERRWHITLDLERCRGVYSCLEVCPEAVFEKREDVRKTELAHDERCIRCGACVVQCPMDALYFEDQTGERVEPETIRRFKLNLLGRRSVAAPP